jgi:acetyltransferase-like isoleucine patch superfamily enzyme
MKKSLRKLGLLARHGSNLITYFLKGGVVYARRIGVTVGNECRIYTRNFGSEPFLITIGNNVTITGEVTFVTHDGSGILFKDQKGRRFLYAPIVIGDNVFVGIRSIILPGVRIGNNVIVAAGSVVTKSIPDGVIVAGVPAKVIGDFSDLKDKALRDWACEDPLNKDLSYKERVMKMSLKKREKSV